MMIGPYDLVEDDDVRVTLEEMENVENNFFFEEILVVNN